MEQENTGSARFIELYSVAAAIEESKNKESGLFRLSVSPNPFSERTEIKLLSVSEYGSNGVSEIKIFDLSGRLVQTLLLPTTYSILPTVVKWHAKGIAPGIYFVEISGSIRQKVVKIK